MNDENPPTLAPIEPLRAIAQDFWNALTRPKRINLTKAFPLGDYWHCDWVDHTLRVRWHQLTPPGSAFAPGSLDQRLVQKREIFGAPVIECGGRSIIVMEVNPSVVIVAEVAEAMVRLAVALKRLAATPENDGPDSEPISWKNCWNFVEIEGRETFVEELRRQIQANPDAPCLPVR